MRKKILSVGSNLSLLGLRNKIFETAGYEVIPARTAAQAIQTIGSHDLGVVIVGHSLSANLKTAVVKAAKEQGLPVVVLHVNPYARIPGVVANLCGTDGAAKILDVLSTLFAGFRQSEDDGQPRPNQIEATTLLKPATPNSHPPNTSEAMKSKPRSSSL